MKVAILGLDCAAPELLFGRYLSDLPNISRLMASGCWGLLESSQPPITVPAWACMTSGCDAGQLGIYGFRNRRDYSYGGYAIANSRAIQRDRLWDVFSKAGLRSIVLGVPPTFPVQPLNGCLVSCFLTPGTENQYTYPAELKNEVERVADGYVFDAENFRTEDKRGLLDRIYAKTKKHLAVARHLVRTRPWDFFMMVEMGVDRIHHGFWSYMDPTHRKYAAGNPFEDAIHQYYVYLDEELGVLLDLMPADAQLLLVSDHGAKKLDGAVCVNEWLIQQGYLALKEYPAQPTPLEKLSIDWARTRAWGDGGYYARIFLNLRGREPQGIVSPEGARPLLDELAQGLRALAPGTHCHRPHELFQEVRGCPPDLIVYFGDLSWRSAGTVGLHAVHTFENDTGPDEANHDWHGVFVSVGADGELRGPIETVRIYDIAPTILQRFGLKPPDGIVGQPLRLKAKLPNATTAERREQTMSPLQKN